MDVDGKFRFWMNNFGKVKTINEIHDLFGKVSCDKKIIKIVRTK